MPFRLLQEAVTGSCSAAQPSVASARSLSSLSFTGLSDAPPASGSPAIGLSVQPDGKGGVNVSVKAGKAQANASYPANSLRGLAAEPLVLYDVARVSVAHSSFMEYLLRLSHERYSLLAQWPDFSSMFSREYYYRSHPEEVRKFYSLVDEFHRMWDVVTDFDSLSSLATHMLPAYRKRHMNVLGPAVGPQVSNGVVAQFLLARAT